MLMPHVDMLPDLWALATYGVAWTVMTLYTGMELTIMHYSI